MCALLSRMMGGSPKDMFRKNPVYQREIGTDSKVGRLFLIIVAFNGILALVTFVMFYSTFSGISNMGSLDYSSLTELYTIMAYIELGMVMLIIPATTAGAITGERERKTLDVMLVGSRHARTIVFGKFLSNIRIILVVMISSIPVLALIFVYGGMRFTNLFRLLFVIMVASMYVGSIGIFCSSICRRTTSAVVMSYGMLVAVTLITIAMTYLAVKINIAGNGMNDYFMLFLNPFAPLVYTISEQLDRIDGFTEMVFYGIQQQNLNNAAGRWIINSEIVQLMVSVILLNVSALIVNPLKFSHIRRLIKRENNGK